MRKFDLHLDALIAIVLVFVLAAGFIVYQRQQYAEVMQENIDLIWEVETMKADLQINAARLEACTSGNEAIDASRSSN
jgi:hypothetical protein